MPAHSPELLWTRLRAQLLSGPAAPDPAAACRQLLAVQAQDPRGFRLAIRARTADTSVEALHRGLSEQRSLVVSWLNRGTLHLVTREDYHWLQALTTPPLWTSSARRLVQEGVSEGKAARAVALVDQWLAEEGPLTRSQLRERLARADVPTAGQALVHILYRCALSGVLVRGPVVSATEQAYVRVRDWLDPRPRIEHDVALGELARRYLVGHAPANERDLARWAGLPLRDARAGLERIAPKLARHENGLVSLREGERSTARLSRPKLLGAFEPLLLGWAAREFVVGPHDTELVAGGVFRPFALVDGRVAATWRLEQGEVQIEPLRPVSDVELAALRRDGERVRAYLQLRR